LFLNSVKQIVQKQNIFNTLEYIWGSGWQLPINQAWGTALLDICRNTYSEKHPHGRTA